MGKGYEQAIHKRNTNSQYIYETCLPLLIIIKDQNSKIPL